MVECAMYDNKYMRKLDKENRLFIIACTCVNYDVIVIGQALLNFKDKYMYTVTQLTVTSVWC